MKVFKSEEMVTRSNFCAQLNEEECNGCGYCIERCQMKAIRLVDEVITLNQFACIGCGNCVTVCPESCLTMVRRSDSKPPEEGAVLMGLEI